MVDLEGGAVSSVSYESTQPFAKQLEDLSVSLNEHSTLSDLLRQVWLSNYMAFIAFFPRAHLQVAASHILLTTNFGVQVKGTELEVTLHTNRTVCGTVIGT